MATVDEKVVRLTMDDSQFDKASDKTIKKLDDLKKSLEFSGAVSSFDELDKAASKVDISPLEKGAESVARKFSALEAIALGALMKIGNQAITTGENLLKSLTIDNIASGWSKYGNKTAAVQTIMSATAKQFADTGEQMAFVESKLERLNWFTDETSYKFLDMVNNIGKFTNNNVELEKAVTAMEGISTWAASAGANTNEAGRAMYNLSQAIAVGSVKLIDWKSIENANMATAEFKQIAIETAEELGTLKKVGQDTWETLSGKEVSVANFNANLSEAWFSSEVLLKTLDRYGGFADRLADVVDETGIMTTALLGYIDDYIDGTLDISQAVSETGLSADELNSILAELGDDQYELGRRAFKAAQETKTFAEAIDYVKEAVSSSWMQSFEYIFGNYTEAKELWSNLSEALYEVFVESGNVRNELLRLWKDNGGRDRFIESVSTALKNIMKLVDAVSEGFKRIFPDTTLDDMLVATRRFEYLIETLTPSEKLLENISNIVEFLVNVISKAIDLAAAVVSGFDPILNLLVDIFDVIMNIAGFTSTEGNDVLNRMFNQENLQKVHDTIYAISEVISIIARILITLGAGAFGSIIQFAKNVWATFKEGEGGISGFFQVIVINVQSAINAFTSGESTISKIVGAIVEKVKELINSFKEAASGGEKNGIGGFLGGIVKSIENSGVFDMLSSLISMLNTAIISIANGVAGIITGGVELRDVISFVQEQLAFLWGWLSAGISKMTLQDLAILALLISFNKFILEGKKLETALTGFVSNISTVLSKLATTIASFANGSWLTDLGTSLTNIAKNTKIAQVALMIYIAVEGIIKLSEVDVGKLGMAVSALGVVIGLVILAVEGLNKLAAALGAGGAKNLARVASSIQAFGIAVGLISASVYALSLTVGDDGDYGKLFASLMAVMTMLTALTAVIAAFDKFNIDTSKFGKIGPALLTFGVTVDLIALAVVALAQFDPTAVLAAASSVAIIIAALGLMGKLIDSTDWSTMLAASAVLITMSGALAIFAVAIAALTAAFASFPDSMAAAMVNLVGIIAALAGAIGLLGLASKSADALGLLAMGAAMISFAGAITILAGALNLLTGISWSTMAQGAALLGAALLAFFAIAGTAQLFSVGLAALAAVLLGLAAAFLAIGAAVSMVADAAVKIGVFVAALVLAGDQLGEDFPNKLAGAFDTLEIIIREFLEMLRNLAPDFAFTFAALIAAGIEAIILVINAKEYAMLEVVMHLVLAVLELLARLGPPIINALSRTIEGMTTELPRLLDAVGDFLEKFFAGAGTLINRGAKGLVKGFFNIFGLEFDNAQKNMSEGVMNNLEASLNEAGYILDEGTGKIMEEVNGTLVEVDVQFNQATQTWEKTLSTGMTNAANNSVNDFNSTFSGKMDESKDNTEKFGKEVGDSAIDGYREATGWGSPWDTILQSILDMKDSFSIGLGGISSSVNTMFYNFGGNAVASMYSGMEDNDPLDFISNLTGYGQAGSLKIINDNPEGTQSTRTIGINPGSQAAAKEVREALATEAQEAGEEEAEIWTSALTDGLISGIGSGSSASTETAKEEIKEESEVIGEAYQEAIDEIDMRAQQTDLEHNLWSAINRDAEEAELVAKNIAYTAKKIAYQQERLDAALTQYDDMIAAYGEDSVEARKAYMTVLEAQTDLVELQNDLVDLQNTYLSNEEELTKRMELVRNNRQLEYDLWVSQNADASDAEKAMMEKQNLQAQLTDATEDLILAQDNYTRAVERYGENSNEAMEAWSVYLKAMIAQSDLQNKLTESQTSSAQDMEQAWRNYGTYLAQHKDEIADLQQLGFTMDEILRSIRQQFGIPEAIQEAQEEVEAAAETSAEQVYEKYGLTMKAGLVALEPQFTQQGATYTTDIAEGMTSEVSTNTILDATQTVIDAALETANSDDNNTKWTDTGEEIINGLIEGLNNKEGMLYKRIEEIINAALAAARKAAAIKSPSRETMWIAEMMDAGLAKGLTKYSTPVISAAAVLMNKTLDVFDGNHTMNTLSFAGGLIAGGLADGFSDYSYQVMNASQGLMDRITEVVESELPGELDSSVIDRLREWGYTVEDMDFDFVMSLNTDKAYEELSEFEKAVLQYRTLSLRAAKYQPMEYEDWAPFYKYTHRKDGKIYTEKKLERLYQEYLDDSYQGYLEAFEEYEEATRLIRNTIGQALKTENSYTEAIDKMASEKTVSYTQNIYSQKPLSTVDIYRNTNNALQQIR